MEELGENQLVRPEADKRNRMKIFMVGISVTQFSVEHERIASLVQQFTGCRNDVRSCSRMLPSVSSFEYKAV